MIQNMSTLKISWKATDPIHVVGIGWASGSTSSVIKASDVTTSSQLLGNTVVSGETRTLVVDISAYEYFEVCICAFDYDTLKETNENISEVTYDESAIKIIAS